MSMTVNRWFKAFQRESSNLLLNRNWPKVLKSRTSILCPQSLLVLVLRPQGGSGDENGTNVENMTLTCKITSNRNLFCFCLFVKRKDWEKSTFGSHDGCLESESSRLPPIGGTFFPFARLLWACPILGFRNLIGRSLAWVSGLNP